MISVVIKVIIVKLGENFQPVPDSKLTPFTFTKLVCFRKVLIKHIILLKECCLKNADIPFMFTAKYAMVSARSLNEGKPNTERFVFAPCTGSGYEN